MEDKDIVSRRGVYRDLSVSPYEFTSPYGDIFKFPSPKKLEIYEREITKELDRLDKYLERSELANKLDTQTVHTLIRQLYWTVYDRLGV